MKLRILALILVISCLVVGAFTPAHASSAVSASNPTNVTSSSATLNGIITSMGGFGYVVVQFEWGESPNYTYTTPTANYYALATFNYSVTLVKDRTYIFRVKYWDAGGGPYYSDPISFVANFTVPVGVDNDWQLIPNNPSDPGLYNDMNLAFPGASWISAFASVTTIPVELMVMILAYGSALVLGLIAYRLTMGSTNKYQKAGAMPLRPGSLFVQAMVSGLIMVYWSFSGGGVIPSWSILPFAIEAITAIIIRQNQGQVFG